MAERHPYPSELDLAAAFRGFLEDAPTQVRPTELAHQLAVAYPHRRGLVGRWSFGLTPAMAWLLLAAGLLLALVVGGVVAGVLRPDRTVVIPVDLVPTGIEVLAPGGAFSDGTRLVAISRDELWATGGGGARHFQDGAWTTESIAPGFPDGVASLALAPGGTLWAAGADGVAYRRDGRWVVADPHPAGLVTVGPDGTVWVAGTASDCDFWSLRSSGSTWERSPAAACPSSGIFGGGGVKSMAVDGRGTLWTGAAGFVVDGLASYSGGRWQTGTAFPGLPRTNQGNVAGIAPDGDPWVVSERYDGAGRRSVWAASFDGTAWTVVELPGVVLNREVAVAPDGALWATIADPDAANPALARYDGRAWTYPYPDVSLTLTSLSWAADGTVFAVDWSDGSVIRLPAPSP